MKQLKFKTNTKKFKIKIFDNPKKFFNTEYLPKRDIKKSIELNDNKDVLEINGYGRSSGGYSNKFIINGSGTVSDDIHTNKFEINGQATLEGNVNAQNIHINGYTTSEKSIVCKNIEINGILKSKSEIDAENMKVNGMVESSQILTKNIEMNCYVGSNVHSIVALNAKLYGFDTFFSRWLPSQLKTFIPTPYLSKPSLNAVLGHSVVLRDINCNYVGGKHVKIKGNSEIQTVEYTHTLIVEEGSKVRNSLKINSDFDFENFFGIQKIISPSEKMITSSEKIIASAEKMIASADYITPFEPTRNVVFNYIDKLPEETRITIYPKLDSLNANLLAKICLESGLSADGTKNEMIERLISQTDLN